VIGVASIEPATVGAMARWIVIALLVVGSRAQAQQAEEVIPPPPPEAPSPAEMVVAPLLEAAEQDLAANRVPLALARTTAVAEVLPEGLPLRVRAEGMRLIAQQRMPTELAPPSPSVEEVFAPLVAQAELDVRGGQPELALARIDLALSRLPPGAPLTLRAQALRNVAMQAFSAPPPPMFVPPPMPAPLPPPPPRDPNERGTGERIELYISAGVFGAVTGAWLSYLASNDTATPVTYGLTIIAGAGLLAVGVLSLDLTMNIPSGVMPTIASSIRFGFAHGLLAMGMYVADSLEDDGPTMFSLVWGGAAVGTLTGLAVGFGATPTVREERFVESMGFWGAGLATSVAMLTSYEDPLAGLALSMIGLDAGLLAGIAMAAAGVTPSTARTLWMDLGFFAGTGLGIAIPFAIASYMNVSPDLWTIGLGMALGSVAGWLTTFLLTMSMDDADPAQPAQPVAHFGVAPLEGGAALTASGAF
jgi:hypothetical protein